MFEVGIRFRHEITLANKSVRDLWEIVEARPANSLGGEQYVGRLIGTMRRQLFDRETVQQGRCVQFPTETDAEVAYGLIGEMISTQREWMNQIIPVTRPARADYTTALARASTQGLEWVMQHRGEGAAQLATGVGVSRPELTIYGPDLSEEP